MNNIPSAVVRALREQTNRLIANHRALLLHETGKISGFMKLLMKPRNTSAKWTSEEKQLLKMHLKHLSCYVPVFIIFAMPFGSLLIPLLAELLDRRRNPQKPYAAPVDGSDRRTTAGTVKTPAS